MPNNRIIVITLNAQAENGRYLGDWIAVWDKTDQTCSDGWGDFRFGQQGYTDTCGHRYDVSVTNPPNATVTVKYARTGASVTIPVALLYRGRALKASGPSGEVYQGGRDVKILQFDSSVVNAARDPNVNAMGLTPSRVEPYR
jgi:hypothetical protein